MNREWIINIPPYVHNIHSIHLSVHLHYPNQHLYLVSARPPCSCYSGFVPIFWPINLAFQEHSRELRAPVKEVENLCILHLAG